MKQSETATLSMWAAIKTLILAIAWYLRQGPIDTRPSAEHTNAITDKAVWEAKLARLQCEREAAEQGISLD